MNFLYFQTFLCQTTHHFSVPIFAALLIEVLSSFQIIQLIFSSMAKLSPSSHFVVIGLNKNLRFLTGAFQLEEVSSANDLLLFIWILCLAYFVSIIFLLLSGIVNKGKRPFKILSWLFLLHSRIFFFPIQFFLLFLCRLYTSSKDPSDTMFYHQSRWLAGSIILLVLNSIFALCKEFIIYQVNLTENNYAIKTNIYHQLILIYKMVALIFDLTGTTAATKGSSVFHFIMGIFLLLALYVKLPFYKFKMLKLAIAVSTVILCLSGVSLIYVCTVKEDLEASGGMQILALLLPPLAVKLVLSQFQRLFKRILQGKFLTAEHAVHFGLLLEDFIMKEKGELLKHGGFFPYRENYYGVLAVNNQIPLEKFTDRKLIAECELPIYSHIIDKISSVSSSSKLLALYIVHINLTKVNNIPKSLELLRKLESSSNYLSLPLKVSLQYLNDLLGKLYSEDDLGSENRLHLSHYFKYYNIANSIKNLMLTETNMQIEFWKEISQKDIDAKKLYKKAEEVDQLYRKIRKECEVNLNSFRKNCTSPMLLYSIYLSHVRQMQSEGIQMLKSFQSIMFAQNEFEEVSENIAIVIVSLDKARSGIILNASGSFHNLFKHEKSDIIGKKFGCLFPSSIAKMYHQNIQQYSKSLEYKLNSKEKTYGKTSNDEIFELEAHFQLYPYVKKELTLMVLLKKLSNPVPILIANQEGVIVDSSKALNMKDLHSLRSLNLELDDANLAFNTVYGQPIQTVRSNFTKETKTWFNSANTVPDWEESSRCSKRSLLQGHAFSPVGAKNCTTAMPFEKAEEICGEYQEGKQMILSLEKKGRFKAQVVIKPFRIEEEVYKIVKINSLKKYKVSECPNESEIKTFGDKFPLETEKRIPTEIAPSKAPKIKGTIESSSATEDKNLGLLSSKLHSEDADTQEAQQQELRRIQLVRDKDEGSSVMNSHHIESRTVKTLRNIGSRKKLQRSLCSLQISLYFVIFTMLILSFVKFELSTNSIEGIEKGISIINLSTLRLQNVINTFLWSLISIIGGVDHAQAMNYFTISLSKFTESSVELEAELGFVKDQDLLNRAFQKDVRYVQLAVSGDMNEIVIDTFTATNILMTKYMAIHKAQDLSQIYKIPDLIQIFNNTVNDYIISSNTLISATDNNLAETISKDIALLKIVLSIEIVALVAYVSVFIAMILIISKSYQRLCRALLRTKDVSVAQRVSQLTKIKDFLEEDIDRKAFIQDAFDLFNDDRRKPLNKEGGVKAQKTTISNVQMSPMNKYLVRIAIICLLFVPLFAALFFGTLVKSIRTFSSLESVNKELSMLSDGSFQSNLMMSTLIYGSLNAGFPSMLFMNKAPLVQINENFVNFNGLNQRLIETFLLSSEGREIDPFLVDILQTDVCRYLSDVSKSLCKSVTNDQSMGLLSLNTDYYNTLQNIVASIGLQTSLANALAAYHDLLNKIIGEMNTMTEIYPIMMSHVLMDFEETVQASKNDEKFYIVAICVTMMVYVVFIYLKPLKDFERVDVGRRKILKLIPFSVIQGNKALKFYLMQDFGAEVEEIKNKF